MLRVFASGVAGVIVGAGLCWLLLAGQRDPAAPASSLATLDARLTELAARLDAGVPLAESEREQLAAQADRMEELAGQVSLSVDQMERLAAGVSRDKVYLEELVRQAEAQAQRSAAEEQRAERAFEKSLAK